MFASLIISAPCAAGCVPTNKMDVNRADFIRKLSKIMFQLRPSQFPVILSSEAVDSENHNAYYTLGPGSATLSCSCQHY